MFVRPKEEEVVELSKLIHQSRMAFELDHQETVQAIITVLFTKAKGLSMVSELTLEAWEVILFMVVKLHLLSV